MCCISFVTYFIIKFVFSFKLLTYNTYPCPKPTNGNVRGDILYYYSTLSTLLPTPLDLYPFMEWSATP